MFYDQVKGMDLFVFHYCLAIINQWGIQIEGDFDLVELKKEIKGNVFYLLQSQGWFSSWIQSHVCVVMCDR